MNEKIIIENHNIIFKYLDNNPINGENSVIDGYRALFIVDNKYKFYFKISDTEYNTDIINFGKLTADYIREKYGDLENCFKEIGTEYLKEKISCGDLKDEKISLIKYLK